MKANEQDLKIKCSDMNLFSEKPNYLHCYKVFYAYFEEIPNVKVLYQVNYEKTQRFIEKEFENQIIKSHSKERYYGKSRKGFDLNLMYLLKGGLLIDMDHMGNVAILFKSGKELEAQKIIEQLRSFIMRLARPSYIHLVVGRLEGLMTIEVKNKKPKMILSENYNDDLLPLHDQIVSSLRKKENNGLYLFHGKPGTGKSTYIRYLAHSINKKVIFISKGLAENLDSPDVLNLLLENKNTIFIIEDAESLLLSRDSSQNSGISVLLNLTDGMLGECLGIQVICTFNTALKNLDIALLRKGRLKSLYEFKELSSEKANSLLQKLGVINKTTNIPMTLADIYNIEETKIDISIAERRPIGFFDTFFTKPENANVEA